MKLSAFLDLIGTFGFGNFWEKFQDSVIDLEFDNLEKLNGLERGSHETFCFFLGVNWVLWDRGPSCRPPKWGRLRVLRGILAGMINKCKMDALWKHIR